MKIINLLFFLMLSGSLFEIASKEREESGPKELEIPEKEKACDGKSPGETCYLRLPAGNIKTGTCKEGCKHRTFYGLCNGPHSCE